MEKTSHTESLRMGVVVQRLQAMKETETFVDASPVGKGCHLAAESAESAGFAASAAMLDMAIAETVVET